ncbi:hypothetical protein IFM89_020664 [Coptis chinensis]|uniref:Nucleolar pre-ribosomal-associated protein 1 n=1 Tax=Coptis chinensis TaxID=261450 RepID=A0A835LJ42_9MAGN|nr:hypothetical protein IFM89_020664 [Coptis chinensis]
MEEDDNEINKEDIVIDEEECFVPMVDIDENEQDIVDEVEVEETAKVVVKTNYEAKLRELLRNLYSLEFKIHSDASKEFIKLLRSDSGGDLLNQYVQASPLCSELLEAWKLRQGKPEVAHVLLLISAILGHPDGKYKRSDIGRINLSRRLDKLASTIIESKMEDIYSELNSKEARRQNAALSVMAAVVRRGIEIGNPRLLRWVLQLRDMYFGVLRGLGSDDDETVIYVLSTLRDRVLSPDSLIPPGLRSVLFGSVTLDQLISISGNPIEGSAAKIAHEVLVMVCTDPCNGLMPDLKANTNPLKGNLRRILELMKKLSAAEIGYHRDLLLAIVQGRPLFGSAYMDEFPYLLEPRASSSWFSGISLATDLVSSTRTSFTSDNSPSLDSSEMQCLLKCIIPRAFSRIVINRGLLHSDVGVRHGSMRLLLEALKSLDILLGAIDSMSSSNNLLAQKWMSLKQKVQDEARALLPDSQVLFKLLSSLNLGDIKNRDVGMKRSRKSEESPEIHLNEVPETDSGASKEKGNTRGTFLMEELEKEEDRVKVIAEIWGLPNSNIVGNKLKDVEQYFHSKLLDALTLYLRTMPTVLEKSFDFFKVLPSNPFTLSISQQQSLLSLLIEYIGWSPLNRTSTVKPPNMMYKHLHPLLDLLMYSPVKDIQDQAYILTQAAMLSTGLFDRNCLEIDAWLAFLPGYRRDKSSMGSAAVEVFQDWSKVVVSFLCDAVSTMGNNLYKYMDHLRCLTSNLKDFAEVSPDFSPLFICTLEKGIRLLDSDSGSFKLSEKSMISMYVSNTLSYILQTQVDGRLLSSLINLILNERFGTSAVCDNSATSFCEWRPLKNLLLFSRSISYQNDDSREFIHEREPLKNPLLLSGIASYQEAGGSMCSTRKDPSATCRSFAKTLGKTKKIIKSVCGGSLAGVAIAFCSSLVCASADEILENFPSVITVSAQVLGSHLPFLSTIFFHGENLLARVVSLWPDIFCSSLELVVVKGSTSYTKDDTLIRTTNSSLEELTSYTKDDTLIRTTNSSLEELISSRDFDSKESAAVAFASYLKQESFHVLFPAIMGISSRRLLDSTKLIDFLQAKLSDCPKDSLVASLRLLLFWAHQIQSSYRVEPVGELEQLSRVCFILIKHIFGLVAKPDTTCTQEIAEIIFHHPALIVSLSDPLWCNKDVTMGNLAGSSGDILSSSNVNIHPISHDLLQLLSTAADQMLSEAETTFNRQLVRYFKTLVHWVVLMFRKKFKVAVEHKNLINLLQSYHVFCALIRIIPPFMLLELGHYIFECCDSICLESVKESAFSIGCYISESAFDLLSSYLHEQNTKTVRFSLFWEVEGKSFDLALIEKVYYRVLHFATCFKIECADLCLLKAVNIVYRQRFMPPQTALLPSSMAISRVIMSSPISLLAHCMHETTATKAKLLFLLTEISALHLTLFGKMFSYIMYGDLPLKENATGEDSIHVCSDEQLMMLLPVALSYLKMNSVRFGVQCLKHLRSIPSIYSRILLDGFLDWNSYTSGNIFQEECGDLLLSSTEELLNFFSRSLLGKAICMLQYYFSLNVEALKMKKRIKLFESICPLSGLLDDILDSNVNDINICSTRQLLNTINRIIAKISLCRMLLFPKEKLVQPLLTEADGHPEDISPEVVHDREESPMLSFINILVSSLHVIVKRFPVATDDSVQLKSTDSSHLFRYLETFILRNIFELSVEMRDNLIQMNNITFVERFARSSLLHRFEDPATLRVLRGVLISQCEGKFSSSLIFELLLSHSKFVSSILWSDSTSDSSGLLNTGTLLRPMSSILRSPILSGSDQNGADKHSVLEKTLLYKHKLEVIKLLRVLYHLKVSQDCVASREDAGMNSKELLSLLLSCYGATVNEIDLEIFDLMHEIVSMEVSESVNIAEMDYLWGRSALKLREQSVENILVSNNMMDCEAIEGWRRRQFRENLALDSKICAATILNFPFDRIASNRPLSLKTLQLDDRTDMLQKSSASSVRLQRYDPAFIMQLSIHCLSMGYLEPLEFAGLGLPAIAFMSISSPDEGLRKVGYEALGRFKIALENCRNRKDVLRLRLLLTYLQNGIMEPWQRIPSITAIFAAEVSFILLDPSHSHYLTISKLLMRSPSVNLKCVPLFNTMFWSISVNFKMDRLWILRLVHAGLNFNDDAHISIRKCLLETLLSFYASSLSDYQSKLLILQIVRKSSHLPVLVRYLVQECNLISWLSSVLSSCSKKLSNDEKSPVLTHIALLLEVVNDVISMRSIIEWLKVGALEQLSEFSSEALKLFIGGSKLIKQNIVLATSILQILLWTLRISQDRDLDQPHFTISNDGLFQLYKDIDCGFDKTRAATIAELVLRAILMNAPPAVISHTDSVELARMIIWAVSTALKSNTSTVILGEKECDDSIMSRLLRWITASIIRGSISRKSNKIKPLSSPERSNARTLQCLLELVKQVNGEGEHVNETKSETECNTNKALAATILYLQQNLGMNCKALLPSVICALCMLCFSNTYGISGSVSLDSDQIAFVALMCSKIRCPAEANPAWRWYFYQPWKDPSSESTETQMKEKDCSSELTESQFEEHHACEALLVIFSNALTGRSSDSRFLSHQDLYECGVFTWEKNTFVAHASS